MVFVKILVFLACTGIAVLILKYTEPIVRMVGKMEWAERYLGAGGTYSAWKLIAILLIVGSLVYLTTVAW
ncbi:MAG: hypothetical protein HW405_669 [Candidatus Berkelbacteria bacterium]|nr:hypothetical protein [Candidatus Berkelbacteria bacterium]